MDVASWLPTLAVPCLVLTTILLSLALSRLAGYIREKTHNEVLARVVEGAARIAGEVYEALRAMPPGSDLAAVKAQAIRSGAVALQERFNESLTTLGAPQAGSTERDRLAQAVVAGELGKLTAASPTEALPPPAGNAAVVLAVPLPGPAVPGLAP